MQGRLLHLRTPPSLNHSRHGRLCGGQKATCHIPICNMAVNAAIRKCSMPDKDTKIQSPSEREDGYGSMIEGPPSVACLHLTRPGETTKDGFLVLLNDRFKNIWRYMPNQQYVSQPTVSRISLPVPNVSNEGPHDQSYHHVRSHRQTPRTDRGPMTGLAGVDGESPRSSWEIQPVILNLKKPGREFCLNQDDSV
jgi:hypothetical protein